MIAQILWWLGVGLEGVLLLRAATRGYLKHYPVFYTYLAYVLIESLSSSYVHARHPAAYALFYWSTQGVSVILGYAVVWEICRRTLSRYEGAFRMARTIVLLIFAAVVFKVLVTSLGGNIWSLARTTAELERAFRSVQAFLILALVGVLAYYRIQIGRNLWGLILGYGFFVATSIFNLTFRSFLGETFQIWWEFLQPIAYIVALLVWCGTLWSYEPNPEPESDPRIEQDYQSLVAATRRRFRQARTYVGRTVRS